MIRVLSRRALEELGVLQAAMRELALERNTALRIFLASRHATTTASQLEFWFEFVWLDQEYRVSVRRLAAFCSQRVVPSRPEK